MLPISDEEKEKIIRLIHAILPDAKIILFGSYARNKARHGSDVDLALDCGYQIKSVDLREVKDILSASNIYHIVDLVDFHKVPETLQHIILAEGISWTT